MSSTSPGRPTLISLGRIVYGLPPLLTWAIILFPIILSLCVGLMLAFPATHSRTMDLLAENSLVENLTVAGYWMGAVLAAIHALRLRSLGRAVGPGALLYSALCFAAGAEEIGWGQQILHFRTPEPLLRVNLQKETTFHNLPFFHDLETWIPLILAVAGLVAIVIHTRGNQEKRGIPSLLAPYALVIILLAGYNTFTDWFPIHLGFDILIGQLIELVEMLIAFAMALGMWLVLRRRARGEPEREVVSLSGSR